MSDETRLLICTVGGSPEAVVASIKHWRPDRVIFITSPQSSEYVGGSIVPFLLKEGVPLTPGQYDTHDIPDAQVFASCTESVRGLADQVERWAERGPSYRVVVDFTGGTKCMSAALALVASRWPCTFSYVGGTDRNKDGVGVVVSGKEQVLQALNPWDSLGYQALEEASTLFDQGDYEAAATLLERTRTRMDRPDRKREMSTLCSLAKAYLVWDRFQHKDAAQHLRNVLPNANDLRHCFPQRADLLLKMIGDHLRLLGLLEDGKPTRRFILDLLANARRCADRGRYDDAVARLYRAVEATAQLRLGEAHGISTTGKVSLADLPPSVKGRFRNKVNTEGYVSLALHDDYAVLEAFGDELATRFRSSPMGNKEKSLLSARNNSILAHGFEPVGKEVFNQLWKAALGLAQVEESELPVFPRLRAPH